MLIIVLDTVMMGQRGGGALSPHSDPAQVTAPIHSWGFSGVCSFSVAEEYSRPTFNSHFFFYHLNLYWQDLLYSYLPLFLFRPNSIFPTYCGSWSQSFHLYLFFFFFFVQYSGGIRLMETDQFTSARIWCFDSGVEEKQPTCSVKCKREDASSERCSSGAPPRSQITVISPQWEGT